MDFSISGEHSVSLLNSGFHETIGDSFDDFASLLLKNLRTSPVLEYWHIPFSLSPVNACVLASTYGDDWS